MWETKNWNWAIIYKQVFQIMKHVVLYNELVRLNYPDIKTPILFEVA